MRGKRRRVHTTTTTELRPVLVGIALSPGITEIHGKRRKKIEGRGLPFFSTNQEDKMLVFKKTDKNIVISGKTFYARDAIKSAGGKWDPMTQSWTISNSVSPEVLKGLEEAAKEEAKKEKNARKVERDASRAATAYALTPLGIAERAEAERRRIAWCLEQKAKTGEYHWICCEKVRVTDWARQHTWCNACGADYGTHIEGFFVRGLLRTGD
jgi:hypothetical protein